MPSPMSDNKKRKREDDAVADAAADAGADATDTKKQKSAAAVADAAAGAGADATDTEKQNIAAAIAAAAAAWNNDERDGDVEAYARAFTDCQFLLGNMLEKFKNVRWDRRYIREQMRRRNFRDYENDVLLEKSLKTLRDFFHDCIHDVENAQHALDVMTTAAPPPIVFEKSDRCSAGFRRENEELVEKEIRRLLAAKARIAKWEAANIGEK